MHQSLAKQLSARSLGKTALAVGVADELQPQSHEFLSIDDKPVDAWWTGMKSAVHENSLDVLRRHSEGMSWNDGRGWWSRLRDPLMESDGVCGRINEGHESAVLPRPVQTVMSSAVQREDSGRSVEEGVVSARAAWLGQMDVLAKSAYYKAVRDMEAARYQAVRDAPQPIIIHNTTNTHATAESFPVETSSDNPESSRETAKKPSEILEAFFKSRLRKAFVLCLTGACFYVYWEWRSHKRRMEVWDRRVEANPVLWISRVLSRLMDKQTRRQSGKLSRANV